MKVIKTSDSSEFCPALRLQELTEVGKVLVISVLAPRFSWAHRQDSSETKDSGLRASSGIALQYTHKSKRNSGHTSDTANHF